MSCDVIREDIQMSNAWLAPIRRGLEATGLVEQAHRQDLRHLIADGADIVMRYRRNPLMPQWDHGGPRRGIPVVRDEQALELFIAGLVAVNVKQMMWGDQKFYLQVIDVNRICRSPTWRSLISGLSRHELQPWLHYEPTVYVFENSEWVICDIKVCLI